MKPSIIVHGGAGSGKYVEGDRRYKELLAALDSGLQAMSKGSSLDGVVAAVEFMEGSGAFNAGKGACLTAAGTVELDAAVITGAGRVGAGVGCVTCTYQPVSLARWIAENTPHVLVAGEECKIYAKKAGLVISRVKPSKTSLEKFRALSEASGDSQREISLWRRISEGNTVGAVAIDSSGVPASAVSTGGKWLKLPGRVGDSAIIGAGVYADSGLGAACATGEGEEIIRNVLCYKACEYLEKGGAQKAATLAINMITKKSGAGTAGIVTVDLEGRVGAAFNTEAMGRAWYDHDKGRRVVRC